MKRLAFLPLALLILSAGEVNSQAPQTPSDMLSTLQTMEAGNKALIDQQEKTMDTLDALDQAAQDVKSFVKRG
jgi:hypothetical protein